MYFVFCTDLLYNMYTLEQTVVLGLCKPNKKFYELTLHLDEKMGEKNQRGESNSA